jgi:hypothetical protein
MRVRRGAARHEVLLVFGDPEDLQRWGSPSLTIDAHLAEIRAHAEQLRALGIPHAVVAFDGAAYLVWPGAAPDTAEARELWARSAGPPFDL